MTTQPQQQKQERVVYLNGEITEATWAQVVPQLRHLAQVRRAIKLIINSPGGVCVTGLGIYDAIKDVSRRAPVTGIVYGQASSMATVIFQACTRRLMAPHAKLMIHALSYETDNALLPEQRENLLWHEELDAVLTELLAERATVTPEYIVRRSGRGEWWLNAEQAVKYGFADGIA